MLPSALAYLLRSRLSLPTLQDIHGLSEGVHVSQGVGHSQDFMDLVPYVPGDDVSSIDWKTTARMGEPIIKRFEQHALATMMLTVDCGNAMAALCPPWSDYEVYTGRSATSKEEVAAEIMEVLAHLALLRGDKVGLVAGNAGKIVSHVPRHGKDHIRRMVADIRRMMDPASPPSDLEALLHRTRVALRQPTVIIIITDTSIPSPNVVDQIRKLLKDHWVGVITVPDANAAAVAGSSGQSPRIVDVGQGLTPAGFFANDAALIREYNAAQAYNWEQMMAAYRQTKATVISLTTRAQLPAALIYAFGRYRSGRRS